MSWELLAPIIARYGIEFAYALWKAATERKEPTEQDWQALRKLAPEYEFFVKP